MNPGHAINPRCLFCPAADTIASRTEALEQRERVRVILQRRRAV